MTTNRAAKNAARARAAETGRSYTAARRENAASSLEPQIVTTTHLVPTYDERSCWLRYTETYGDQTHEAVVRDADVVARAHAGALAADELHRLTGSPLPVPVDSVVLDMNAAEVLGPLADHNEVMLRITSQLRGSVGLLLNDAGAIAGAWMRQINIDQQGDLVLGDRDDVVVCGFEMSPQVGAPSFDDDLDAVFMDTPDDCYIYAINRGGIRVVYDPASDAPANGNDTDVLAEVVESRLRDDDVALAASPARIRDVHDAQCVVFALRGTDGWETSSDYYCVSRNRNDDLPDGVIPNDVRFMPTNATDMISFGRLPIPGQNVEVGRSVQVLGLNKWWWKVAARDERYIVLTRGNSRYGVIDLSWNITYNGVTPGPAMSSLDTLGGGWGDIEHPETILEALRTGQAEISHRRVVAVEGLVVR